MAVDYHTELGSPDDRVSLSIGGNTLPNYVNYSVKTGVMQQPSTWSVTLGAGRPNAEALTAGDLMRIAEPGKSFELRIGSTLVQSGIVEDRDISDSGGTTVTVGGRDWMWPLVKNSIRYDVDFGQPTYYEMTRKVLDLCGLSDRALVGDNEANRKTVSRTNKATSKPMSKIVESEEIGAQTNSNKKVQVQRVIGKLGSTWFDFLKRQYKKVGLYLWATADGNFVLSRPTGTKNAIYRIVRKRGAPRSMTNVLSRTLRDHTSGRSANYTGHGKSFDSKGTINKPQYSWPDFELKQYGFDDWQVIYDTDAKTAREAQYVAKRKMAEDMRANWVLSYTLSGHTTPDLSDPGKMLIWAPDTLVNVIDEDLGDLLGESASSINSTFATGQDCYVEDIEFRRAPQTTTTVHLMRKQDLYYLGESSEFESDLTRPRAIGG